MSRVNKILSKFMWGQIQSKGVAMLQSLPNLHATKVLSWSLRPYGVDLLYFKNILSKLTLLYNLTYQSSMTLNCKDIGIRKSEFVAKHFQNSLD